MRRVVFWLCLWVGSFASCGPDNRRCSGPHPDFVVLLELTNRALPSNTVVTVGYAGSGVETYDLAKPRSDPEVVFCAPANRAGEVIVDSAGAAGAAGAAGETVDVEALRCELWTAGFTKLTVRGDGLIDTDYELSPDEDQCTVKKRIVLDSPDAG